MQDAENVAAPEAAEERAEPGQQQPAAEPPGEEPARPEGPGAQEAADGEDEEAEAGPGPEVPAEPAADGEEAAGATPGPSPPPPEEPPAAAPAEDEAPGEQARDAAAEARSDGAGGVQGGPAEDAGVAENGDADEPSFSDPEDFVDDVSEEGEAPGSRTQESGGRGVPILHPAPRSEGRFAVRSRTPSLSPVREGAGWRQPGDPAIPTARAWEGGGGRRRPGRSEGRAARDTTGPRSPGTASPAGGVPSAQRHLSKLKPTRRGPLAVGGTLFSEPAAAGPPQSAPRPTAPSLLGGPAAGRQAPRGCGLQLALPPSYPVQPTGPAAASACGPRS